METKRFKWDTQFIIGMQWEIFPVCIDAADVNWTFPLLFDIAIHFVISSAVTGSFGENRSTELSMTQARTKPRDNHSRISLPPTFMYFARSFFPMKSFSIWFQRNWKAHASNGYWQYSIECICFVCTIQLSHELAGLFHFEDISLACRQRPTVSRCTFYK